MTCQNVCFTTSPSLRWSCIIFNSWFCLNHVTFVFWSHDTRWSYLGKRWPMVPFQSTLWTVCSQTAHVVRFLVFIKSLVWQHLLWSKHWGMIFIVHSMLALSVPQTCYSSLSISSSLLIGCSALCRMILTTLLCCQRVRVKIKILVWQHGCFIHCHLYAPLSLHNPLSGHLLSHYQKSTF